MECIHWMFCRYVCPCPRSLLFTHVESALTWPCRSAQLQPIRKLLMGLVRYGSSDGLLFGIHPSSRVLEFITLLGNLLLTSKILPPVPRLELNCCFADRKRKRAYFLQKQNGNTRNSKSYAVTYHQPFLALNSSSTTMNFVLVQSMPKSLLTQKESSWLLQHSFFFFLQSFSYLSLAK